MRAKQGKYGSNAHKAPLKSNHIESGNNIIWDTAELNATLSAE